ncbi:MAG: rRNA pseudouridine synthase [Deltaproteobacteria bacterium]|nr:MAG: rRNA pseudouridine synthase [Deltaproteobacteria bacterium]
MAFMRLQKFLSSAGVCSRRKGEEYIRSGRVKVNDRIVKELGTKVDPQTDQIAVNGNTVELNHDNIYIALNKPKGYIASCSRRQADEKIVMDLLDISLRIYPIGRLDKDSSGLLLLTNDGELHHRLLHPSFDHEKEYEVTVDRPVADGALRKLAQGLPMMGTKTRAAKIKRLSARRFRIILQEGKNRQIRRMVRKVGARVSRLKRVRVANIKIGRLAEGSWRHLTEKERKALLAPKKVEVNATIVTDR